MLKTKREDVMYGSILAKSVTLTVSLLFLPILATARADSEETFFKEALGYTVKIKTTVSLPFVENVKGMSKGAGFVVDVKRGWIMTNAHVAKRSPSEVTIAFDGGDYRSASKIYVDPYLDLAIIKVGTADIPKGTEAAPLDCGALPGVGHPVGAYGHPWGLSYTGTRGIISGVTAKIQAEMLQTDAPINGGNSGGPLISLRTGKVVGINTSSVDDEGDQNTNFAVPMKYACRVFQLLLAGKDPSPPELPMAFFLDIDDRKTLVVAKTYRDKAPLGLQAGDVIRGVVGVTGQIENEAQLMHALRGRLDQVQVRVARAGKPLILGGRLRPVDRVTQRKGVYVSGVLFAVPVIQDFEELNLGQTLMVHYVESDSIGETLEIEENDFLESIDGRIIYSVDELYEYLLSAQNEKKTVTIILKRADGRNNRLFAYVKRSLSVSELKFIGIRGKNKIANHRSGGS